MRSETREEYIWALEKLRSFFLDPGILKDITYITDRELAVMSALAEIFTKSTALLYRWQINKNIFAKQRSSFSSQYEFAEFMKAWNMLVNSATDSEYNDQLRAIERMIPPHVMYYVNTTWLIHEERFVNAWIRCRHFGHTSTSRVESAHTTLKRWISVSSGIQILDIFNFVDFISYRSC